MLIGSDQSVIAVFEAIDCDQSLIAVFGPFIGVFGARPASNMTSLPISMDYRQ